MPQVQPSAQARPLVPELVSLPEPALPQGQPSARARTGEQALVWEQPLPSAREPAEGQPSVPQPDEEPPSEQPSPPEPGGPQSLALR